MAGYTSQIVAAAGAAGISPGLALAVAQRESGGRQYDSAGNVVTGTHGELGIFQLMPATAAALGVDPRDPAQNIQGGVQFLAQMIQAYGLPAGLWAYNWGPGNVQAALAGQKAVPASVKAYASWVLARAGSYAPATLNLAISGPGYTPPAARPAAVPWGWLLGALVFTGLIVLA